MFIRIADQIINANAIRAIRKYNEALYWYIIVDLAGDNTLKFGPFTEDQADQIMLETGKALNIVDLNQTIIPTEG